MVDRLPEDSIDLFLSRADGRPGHPAVTREDESITYGTLADRTRRVAARIWEYREPKVLVALPQGPDAYAAMLGVGLGGGVYTPLNLAAPRAKLEAIARLVQPNLIIGSRDVTDSLRDAAPGADVADIHDLYKAPPLLGRGRRHPLAYLIFTSGSTGVPKGVMVPRGAFDHYVASIAQTLGITASDKVSQHPNIAFDVSVMEIYGALCQGATLCPITGKGDRLMPARAIAREKLSIWVSVPSVVSLMMRAGQVTAENLASVRLFGFCGEPLLKEHLDAIFSARPEAIVVNTYGPTEATVSVTALHLTRHNYLEACLESVAIGDPIDGMYLDLVGGPDADEGEIVISGPQLAVGYWKNPEQTEKSFRTLRLRGRLTRAYFSGDWAKRSRGNLHCKGRLDFQVKIHGHRLELDEVAAAIRAFGWPEVCVLMWRDRLTAVIETRDGKDLDEAKLRRSLGENLESHAIPAVIRAAPVLPRSENDKIDRASVAKWLDANVPAITRE